MKSGTSQKICYYLHVHDTKLHNKPKEYYNKEYNFFVKVC